MIDHEAPQPIISAPDQSSGRTGSNRLFMGCLGAFLILVVFVVGAGIGFGFGRISASSSVSNALASLAGTSESDLALRSDLTAKFGTFWEAMDVLYQNYYGELPEGDAATYAAVRGIVDTLGDPNTSFYTPNEADVFRTNLTGSFEGIGARVDWDTGADTVRIVEPFENQPAWLAGIKRDDLVLAVDGESVVGTDLNSAVARIRGPKGSAVVLTILREGENEGEPFDVEVVRDRIETPTVTTDSLGDDGEVAYVRLYTFNENAGTLVKQAVEDAVRRGAQGLILDLRGNSGGLLREAVKVSSLFIENSVVLLERDKSGKEQIFRTEGSAPARELPMVVLVNEGSASASEIVAGALQDADRAELVGVTTFGKGSVQLPESLEDGSILRVTVARWYTPEGRTIDGTGLAPDIEVTFDDSAREAGEDPQLERALAEVLARIPLQSE